MKTRALGLTVLVVGSVLSTATAQEAARNEGKADHEALSRLVHKMVAGQFPKTFEYDEGWGTTIPIPEKLSLPRLRTRVRVGDREELPHGPWRKVRGRIIDPERDLTVRVRGLTRKGDGPYRLSLDVDVALCGELELQRWQKGLLLLNPVGQADVVVSLAMEWDVTVKVDPKAPLSKVKLEPMVAELKLGLKEFALKEVTLKRLGPILQGESAREAGELLRGIVVDLLRSQEPQLKEQLNQAIARGLASGQGNVSTSELLKALSPPSKKK
ncbi:MAG: hypothetical protein L0Z62_40785 [Gemmataceae bacterium]|nr:hypothetical protein [Gemmataceae bacterium]